MEEKTQIQLFESKKVRTLWDNDTEEWYFSVVDVVAVLTDSVNPTDYIKKMRKRDPLLAQGWGQLVTHPCGGHGWWKAEIQFFHYGGNIENYPIHTISKSGAFQIVDGTGGERTVG